MHEDRLIYVLEEAVGKKAPKLPTKLTKLGQDEAKVEDKVEDLLTYFGMDPALASASMSLAGSKGSKPESEKPSRIDFNALLRQECMTFSTLSFIQ